MLYTHAASHVGKQSTCDFDCKLGGSKTCRSSVRTAFGLKYLPDFSWEGGECLSEWLLKETAILAKGVQAFGYLQAPKWGLRFHNLQQALAHKDNQNGRQL